MLDNDLSRFETLSLLGSIVALAISVVALIRGNRVAKRQLELQQQQADFAKFQHKILTREQTSKAQAGLRAAFVRDGSSHKFILKNAGPATARNVRFATPEGESAPAPFVGSQVEDIFPLTELRAGDEVRLIAAIEFGTRLPLPLIFTWDDDAGDNQQREIKVQIV